MHSEDLLDAEAVDQTVFTIARVPAAAFFRRLEDDRGGAGEIAGLRQILRCPEQHGGVAVMAAGVHLPGHRRFVGDAPSIPLIGKASISARRPDIVAPPGCGRG